MVPKYLLNKSLPSFALH